jgi:lipoprotein signal peptidase
MEKAREHLVGVEDRLRPALSDLKAQGSALIKMGVLATFIICLDLGTKALIANSYLIGEQGQFLFVSIFHVQNPGIILGPFVQLGLIDKGVAIPDAIFLSLSAVGAVVLILAVAKEPSLWLPLGLMLGGFANIIDFLQHGYVTDFIHVTNGGRSGSANLADFSLLLGTFALLMSSLLRPAGPLEGDADVSLSKPRPASQGPDGA